MRENQNEEIDKLIKLLWVNDREEVYDGWEELEEPKDAIKALTAFGKPVVGPLIKLLQYTKTFAAEYASRILGDIGDERAIAPLLTVLEDNDTDSEVWEAAKNALKKFGKRAQQPILQYLKQRGEEEDYYGVDAALELLEDFKSQSLFEAAVALLSAKNKDIHRLVALWFGEYGDKRAVPYLKQLLEDPGLRTATMKSLGRLVEVSEYRTLIAPYVEKRMAEYKHRITNLLEDISWAYDEKYGTRFQGDGSESLNFVAREDEIMKNALKIAFTIAKLLEEELLGVSSEVESVWGAMKALEQKHRQFEDYNEEELELTRDEIYGIHCKQKRTYSRLASYFDELQNDLVPWLRQQDFKVVWRKQLKETMFVRKCTEIQRIGCIIKLIRPYNRRKTQGTVQLHLWGEDRSDPEMEAFYVAFWERIAAKATEVGGKLLDEANT